LSELPSCLTRHAERVWLAVSVVPNAKRTGADGLHDGALRVRLAAPPVDGKANEVLLQWVAKELALPHRAVTLARGERSRRKWLEIDAPQDAVAAWARRLAADSPCAG
jgi:uncharacterized protein (TIGR00251 family)